jgi:hypothetical protein
MFFPPAERITRALQTASTGKNGDFALRADAEKRARFPLESRSKLLNLIAVMILA